MTLGRETENQTNNRNKNDECCSPIQKFYDDANVFITGGTGFLGTLLLEKLLASCPNISYIYMLVRAKKGKSVETRLDQHFEDVVFSRLKKQHPNFREKIVPVEGDCELPDLGLSNQDRDILIAKVNIIFHGAATVRFDEHLRKASFINIRGVRDITRLAQQMPNLKSFVHISTAYSNCVHSHIKEEVYPPVYDYEKLLVLTEALPEDTLTRITPMLLGNYPNTYSYTKQIGEDVVTKEGVGLPIGIHRPSIIQSTFKDPCPGWTNNYYGPNGFVAVGAVGLQHISLIYPGVRFNMVPADLVVNSIIATAWDVAEKFVEKDRIPVYNFESSQSPILTWENYTLTCQSYAPKYCPVTAIWWQFYTVTQYRVCFIIGKLLFHKIPGIFVDTIRFLSGKRPRLLKLYEKIDKIEDVLMYFILRDWSFESTNVSKLKNKMSEGDKKIFSCEMRNFNWDEYFEDYIRGVRVYLVKDPLETVPEGQKRYRKLYWIHQLTMAVIVLFIMLLLWFFYFAFKNVA